MNNFITAMFAAIVFAMTPGYRQMAVARGAEIKNSSAAISRAIALTGLDHVSKKISAQRITVHGDSTPFLAAQFEGKKAWRVVFDKVSLTGRIKGSPVKDPYEFQRKFIVLLDAHTGQLLEINTEFSGDRGDLTPDPSAASAENQLKGCAESYTGLPAMDPKITFFDAVNRAEMGCPMVAREVNGLYVMDSRMGDVPHAVWMVTLRGFPPEPMPGPRGANPTVNTGRTVIDAVTGVTLFATNCPQ